MCYVKRRVSRIERITRGDLLGVGGHRLLIWDCDAGARCAVSLVEQRTRHRTELPAARAALLAAASGSIDDLVNSENQLSPDGTSLAVTILDGNGVFRLHVINLVTGRADTLPGATTDCNPNRQMAWTPNSRWLLALTDHQVRGYDTSTRRTRHR